jgi:anti-anti-sigma regulatory factor
MSKNVRVVTPEGKCTIERSQELKSQLLDGLEESVQKLLVNLSHVTEIDTSFVLLLYAAKQEASKQDKQLHLSGSVQESVQEALQLGGFCEHASESAPDLEDKLLDFR